MSKTGMQNILHYPPKQQHGHGYCCNFYSFFYPMPNFVFALSWKARPNSAINVGMCHWLHDVVIDLLGGCVVVVAVDVVVVAAVDVVAVLV